MAGCIVHKEIIDFVAKLSLSQSSMLEPESEFKSPSDTSTKPSSEVTCKPRHLPTSSEFIVVTRKSGRRKSGKNRQPLVKSIEKNSPQKFDFDLFNR